MEFLKTTAKKSSHRSCHSSSQKLYSLLTTLTQAICNLFLFLLSLIWPVNTSSRVFNVHQRIDTSWFSWWSIRLLSEIYCKFSEKFMELQRMKDLYKFHTMNETFSQLFLFGKKLCITYFRWFPCYSHLSPIWFHLASGEGIEQSRKPTHLSICLEESLRHSQKAIQSFSFFIWDYDLTISSKNPIRTQQFKGTCPWALFWLPPM